MNSVANHLWSTLFAAAAMLLALALRHNRAQTRYWLWMAASLKFLLPFSLLVSIGSLFELPRAAAPPPVPAVTVAIAQIGHPFTPLSIPTSAATPISLPFLGIWLCGVVGVTALWWTRWRRIQSALRAATPFPIEAPIRVMSSPALLEPGVFGIVRPILLLPAGITDRLTPDQLDVRRHDNLAAALHMVVEALFWFHPLVWWIGARLIEERERACDEEVVALGNSPRAYAEGIVGVCRLYLQSQLPCAAGVTGAELKKRITAILGQRRMHSLTPARKLLLAAAALAAIAGPILIGAQARRPLVFEVASIRPTKSDATYFSIRFMPGGALNVSHTSLKELIGFAYDVQEFQISGGPGWLGADRFDIAAKPDHPVDDDLGKMSDEQRRTLSDQLRERTRALLEDRFQLRVHTESKEGPIYALVVAKGGPKLKPATGQRNNSQRAGGGGGTFQATRWTPAMLAQSLRNFVGRTVVDQTGITGEYDIELTWSPNDEAGGTSIFTAIQEQLGLKLESSRGPVGIIVVDRAEKPSEN